MIAGVETMQDIIDRLSKRYVLSDRDRVVDAQLDRFFDLCNRARRSEDGPRKAPGLVVIGNSGAGKSRTLRRALSKHPSSPTSTKDGGLPPLISINAPASCSLLALGRALLSATGYPIVGDPITHVVWSMVHERLPRVGVIAIHIDEFHNVVRTGNVLARSRLLDQLKSLMNDQKAPTGLILSGLPEVVDFLNSGTESSRRMRAVRFDPLTFPSDAPSVAELVKQTSKRAGCACDEDFGGSIVERLIHAGNGQLGIVLEIIWEAVAMATTRSQRLNINHFYETYFSRTSASDIANPFSAAEWKAIEVSRLLAETAKAEKPKGRGRGKSNGGTK